MRSRGARALVAFLSFTAAVAANTGLFLGLARINGPAAPAPSIIAPGSLLLRADDAPAEVRPPTPPPKPEPTPEAPVEPLQVDLDAPPSDPTPAEPLEVALALEVPGSSAIKLAASPLDAPSDPEASAEAASRSPRPARARPVSAPASSGPEDAERVDEPPREHSANTRPEYPRFALRRRIEGAVAVRLLINEDGAVDEVLLQRVTGPPCFAEAVLDVAKGWRFDPARHRGLRVKVWASKTLDFKIR